MYISTCTTPEQKRQIKCNKKHLKTKFKTQPVKYGLQDGMLNLEIVSEINIFNIIVWYINKIVL